MRKDHRAALTSLADFLDQSIDDEKMAALLVMLPYFSQHNTEWLALQRSLSIDSMRKRGKQAASDARELTNQERFFRKGLVSRQRLGLLNTVSDIAFPGWRVEEQSPWKASGRQRVG